MYYDFCRSNGPKYVKILEKMKTLQKNKIDNITKKFHFIFGKYLNIL